MRVLQVNSVFGVGSTGRIVRDIHGSLLDSGHESFVAYGRQPLVDQSNAIRIGNQRSVYAHVAKTRLLDKHGFGSTKATSEFLEIISGMRLDLIHLHNIHGYYMNVDLLFSYIKHSEIPVVWTFHDCWPFTGHCAYFTYANCEKWKTQCRDCPQSRSYPSAYIDNSIANFRKKQQVFTGVKNLHIVTPSVWLADLVKGSYLSEYPVEVIRNGIDLSSFKPTECNFRSEYGLEGKTILLGVASIWDERKGLKFFFELASIISNNEHIVLVGVRENETKGKTIPNNMTIIPRTNDVKELAGLYTTADYFLNPTLEDNYPTTNLEAIACGTPVVAFNTGGVSETIRSSNGVLAQEKTAVSLYKAVLNFRQYSFEDSVRATYGKDVSTSSYLSLYYRVLQGVR